MDDTKSAAVKKEISIFLQKGFAILKGDTEEAMLLANEKKCIRFVKTQINALENKVDDLQSKVQDAKDAEDLAIYPVTPVSSEGGQSYVDGIVEAGNKVKRAEKELKNAQETLLVFKQILKEKF